MASRRNFLASVGYLSAKNLLGDRSLVLGADPKATRELARQKMRIVSVDAILTGRVVYVKITTDAGIVGYGDATNHSLPQAAIGMLKDLSPYLIGEDPHRIEYLWQTCYRRRFMRGGPAIGTALAGIDQALWDIKGKACGLPVYQMLGGMARTKVRAYGHVTGTTAEAAASAAKERVSRVCLPKTPSALKSQGLQDPRSSGEIALDGDQNLRETVPSRMHFIVKGLQCSV